MVEHGRREATEGLNVDMLRERMLSQVYRQSPRQETGSQGRDIAVGLAQDSGRQVATADAETQIGLQDDEVRRQGRATLSEALTQRQQLKSQRDAAVAESRMMVEAEAGQRRQALLGGVMNLASAAINPSSIRNVFEGIGERDNFFSQAEGMADAGSFAESAMQDSTLDFTNRVLG